MRQFGPLRERISAWAIKDEHCQFATQPVSGRCAQCDRRLWTWLPEGFLDLGAARNRRSSSCQAVRSSNADPKRVSP
jgi:hypothetical protein